MSSDQQMSGPRVLIVDDEASLRDELSEYLASQGLQTLAVSDGAEALARLADDPAITVVLSDIRMPEFDGICLAMRLKGARTDADAIEVVLMTGHANLDLATQAVRAGVFDFLRKPMRLDDLVAVVRRAHVKALARREAQAIRAEEMRALRADYEALQARFSRVSGLAGLDTPPELSRILSHELRTPLMPIIGLYDVLGHGANVPAETLSDFLRDMQAAGERILTIADDLIEFLAPPGAADFTWRPASSSAILDRLSDLHAAQARTKGLELRIEPATDTVIETDADFLVTALGRLALNAINATPAGGAVSLSASAGDAPGVTFSVRDQGVGMSADQIALARKPFHQLDMSLTRRSGGLGLGLTLAERMSEPVSYTHLRAHET